jgi:curved DNA-binding protein CbpA
LEDYYQVLGISRHADAETIRKAFRTLAFRYHPDQNPDDQQATMRFRKLHEAYQTLIDPEKRKYYDNPGLWEAKKASELYKKSYVYRKRKFRAWRERKVKPKAKVIFGSSRYQAFTRLGLLLFFIFSFLYPGFRNNSDRKIEADELAFTIQTFDHLLLEPQMVEARSLGFEDMAQYMRMRLRQTLLQADSCFALQDYSTALDQYLTLLVNQQFLQELPDRQSEISTCYGHLTPVDQRLLRTQLALAQADSLLNFIQ